jgi:hypothetical protein
MSKYFAGASGSGESRTVERAFIGGIPELGCEAMRQAQYLPGASHFPRWNGKIFIPAYLFQHFAKKWQQNSSKDSGRKPRWNN